MANKMLIDASHPEETRVVVLRGNRIEDFDFEAANKKPLRGNIYLAKVTRVEPSLQAAFIEYGGNRHGFLAFSEIHPDYYQIPVADRQALLDEEARQHSEEEEEEPRNGGGRRSRRNRRGRDRSERRASNGDETVSGEAHENGENSENGDQPHLDIPAEQPDADFLPHDGEGEHRAAPVAHEHEQEPARLIEGSEASPPEPIEALQLAEAPQPQAEPAPAEHTSHEHSSDVEAVHHADAGEAQDKTHGEETEAHAAEARHGDEEHDGEHADDEDDEDEDGNGEEEEEHVEMLGGDALEEMPRRAPRSRRQYKIQEVIRRRQVLLVQVVKEERGNKGAALTTYLSLAGRYSVLMPNTARGGGISRKITDGEDRKRLKEIAQELDVPEGMGVILRTAGAARTKQEVRRDFEYLLRMWESVRELTLESTAPSLVYEEGSLIKRSIRDLFNKDIDDITVSGEAGFEEARSFMGMLMPTHVRNVRQWNEPQPLFAKYGVEQQLDGMFSTQVTLKSGGYIVINSTEALVAIDVNSGRSTREHNIEDTALRTNVEAADEVARQLRLRDLAGLIVVDFIDMEEHRNNRTVERRLKEALRADRARIQVGRISHFGLLEMSRQRMRPGVLEGSSVVCPHCAGAGTVRSTSSIALHVLRVLEDGLIRNASFNMTVKTRSVVALYILNQKRAHLRELEERFGVAITVLGDDTLAGSVYHTLERGEPATAVPAPTVQKPLVRVDSISPYDDEAIEESDDEDESNEQADSPQEARGDGEQEAGRRRRRRRRGRNRESSGIDPSAPQPSDDALAITAGLETPFAGDPEAAANDDAPETANGEAQEAREEREGRGRRRSRRGNRRGPYGLPRNGDGDEHEPRRSQEGAWIKTDDGQPDAEFAPYAAPAEAEAEPASGTHEAHHDVAPEPQAPPAPVHAHHEAEQPTAPIAVTPSAEEQAQAAHREVELLPEAPPPQQKRGGWWQRAKSTFNGE
ncbi:MULTISPECIES: ribonuclease E/G [unclassified Beijerinckia]|uniref:Rne/Rng family ribonuclease n=1 Tax=unclassified Beijerinckia TaxID=2638183 RepID=UPI00089D6464|nr:MULTISPECIES: ribonuclease E/G [unclassified Beijerinckia]MDH7794862.1 ribonuclease E [Beijerinckia sp. GAS462]SEB78229.1 RNAse E [Beijerinckia sp. 28-YEA-48]